MSDEITIYVVKKSADYLREYYAREGVKLKSGHAHELVASYFGYKSKIALLADEDFMLDPQYPDTFNPPNPHEDVTERIERLRDSPVDAADAEAVVELIGESALPPCDLCGEDRFDVQRVEGEPDVHEPKWSCHDCAKHDPAVGYCIHCGDEYIFLSSDLNRDGECDDHEGESRFDDEELEDMESLVEYHLNH